MTLPPQAQAQQTLTLHENLVTNEVPSLWNISLATNTPKDYEEIQIKLSLANANEKTIYEVVSPDILLSSRQVKTLNSGLGIAQTLVNDLNGSTLPDGRYEVSYREYKSNHLLKQRQFTVNGTAITFIAQADSGKLNVKKWINTAGTARLTSAYSSPPGLQSQQLKPYSRLEANPTLILGGVIPIGANVLLSTEQNLNGQPMAQASLNFDPSYFRALLEKKAMSKIESAKPEELANVQALKEKFMDKKFRHLDEWREKFASPEALQELAQAEAYKKLEAEKAKLEEAMDPTRLEELQAQYEIESLEQLEARQDGLPDKDVNEMKFLMQTTTALKEAEAKMEELKSAKEQADKLLAQKEKLAQLENTGYLQMLRDPHFSGKMLKQLGVRNAGTQLLGGIKSLGAGTCYPLYTPLTMSGIRVQGFHFEWNPGLLYVAASKGQLRAQRWDPHANRYTFERQVMAARLGLGKKAGTHLVFTYLGASDEGPTFYSPNDSTATTPQANLIVGTEGQFTLFRRRFIAQGEFNLAATNANNDGLGFPFKNGTVDRIMGYFDQLRFVPNATTSLDYAYQLQGEMHLFKDNTRISGNCFRIGPRYNSFATPFLMVDQLRYEGKVNQAIWKKRINLGGFYKYYRDNLIPQVREVSELLTRINVLDSAINYEFPRPKEFTTQIRGFGAEATISIPKLPTLWAKYLPVSQTNNFNAVPGQPQPPLLVSDMGMGGLSYSFNLFKFGWNTQVQLSRYSIVDNVTHTSLLMNAVTAMQTVAFSNGMNCTAVGFLNRSANPELATQAGLSLSATALILKKVATGLEVHHQAQGSTDTKTGLTANLNYRIFKNLSAQGRFTYNGIKSAGFGNQKESFGNLVLLLNW